MLSVSLLVAVAAAYFLGHPNIAFWIVVIGLVNGALGLIKAVVNRDWYEQTARAAGVEPNYSMLFGTKFVALAVNFLAAWYLGTAANYF